MDYEKLCQKFWEHLGYSVEKIREGPDESPDFLISDGVSTYLLELKTKLPTKEEIEERKNTLNSGGIFQIHEKIIRTNRLSNIIKKAKNQLQSYPKSTETYNILWLLTVDHLAEPRMFQFMATLFGTTTIADIANNRAMECFFFYNSEFYRYRDILDAAFVSIMTDDKLEGKLLINNLSPRYFELKNSSLVKHLETGLVDPVELDKMGLAFVVDSDVDRNNKEEVLQYLRDKYKLDQIIDVTMNYLSGTMPFKP